eukprot:126286_1
MYLLMLWICLIPVTCSSLLWNTSNVTLPRSDQKMAVGTYDNSIFLLGGATNGFQVMEYDIINNVMIDHGTNILSTDTYGNGQFYTQINEIVLMIGSTGTQLSSYNLITKQVEYDPYNMDIPVLVYSRACLTSFEHYLFVIGGGDGNRSNGADLSKMQILNLSNYQWISGPLLKLPRIDATCNVHPVTYTYLVALIEPRQEVACTLVKILKRYMLVISTQITGETWSTVDGALLPTDCPRSVV